MIQESRNAYWEIDEVNKERYFHYMGESIEAAISKVKDSKEYQDYLNSSFSEELTLQNLEQEAIYKQGYMDCLIQLLEIGVVRKG